MEISQSHHIQRLPSNISWIDFQPTFYMPPKNQSNPASTLKASSLQLGASKTYP